MTQKSCKRNIQNCQEDTKIKRNSLNYEGGSKDEQEEEEEDYSENYENSETQQNSQARP